MAVGALMIVGGVGHILQITFCENPRNLLREDVNLGVC
jgi:hypothetical protein